MKKCLIVIDFQNDFVSGTLGFEGAEKLDLFISKRIEKALINQEDLFFTLDTHKETYLDSYEGKNLPVLHCVKGSKGHELYGETAKYRSKAEKVFEKPTFPSLDLANYLSNHHYDEVELCGLVSNICVLSNAVMVKSALPEAKIIVNQNLTDSYDKDLNSKTFDILRGLQVEVIQN